MGRNAIITGGIRREIPRYAQNNKRQERKTVAVGL